MVKVTSNCGSFKFSANAIINFADMESIAQGVKKMFTIWIDDIHVETVAIDFLLAVTIAKILSSENPDHVVTVRENGTVIFKKWC